MPAIDTEAAELQEMRSALQRVVPKGRAVASQASISIRHAIEAIDEVLKRNDTIFSRIANDNIPKAFAESESELLDRFRIWIAVEGNHGVAAQMAETYAGLVKARICPARVAAPRVIAWRNFQASLIRPTTL